MAWFPLDATFNTSEINNCVSPGFSRNVILANGPDGRKGGSYEFQHNKSVIEFSNNHGGYVDMRYSVTILYWLYHLEVASNQESSYHIMNKNESTKGLEIFYSRASEKLKVRIRHGAIQLISEYDSHKVKGWRFLGTTYNRSSGEAKLWVDGNATETKTVTEKDFELGTQYPLKIKSNNFKGRITQLWIYNYPLTQEQIQKIKAQFNTPQSGGESKTIRLTEASISGQFSLNPCNYKAIESKQRRRQMERPRNSSGQEK